MSDSRWVLPTTFIGFEGEYEGVLDRTLPKHPFADFWAYHEEGSLKDHGAEYAFSNPLFGVDAYNAIDWLVSHSKSAKWKCTKRTGIHIHLDVRDLTVPQFGGMSMLYGAVEPILYRWVGDGRASSHFCIPLYRADEALLGACAIIKAAHADEKQEGSQMALDAAEGFQRYAGYNLQALHKFGSVEFRQLQTTNDMDRIITWVNIVMSLKAAAYKLPQSDGAVVRMLETMSVEEVLGYVFPKDIAKQLYTKYSEEEFRCIGLPSARDIAVHGCGETSWISADFPKGENEGFIKWIKESKDTRYTEDKAAYNEFELEEEEREEGDFVANVANDPPPVPVQEDLPAWRVPPAGWAINEAVAAMGVGQAEVLQGLVLPPPLAQAQFPADLGRRVRAEQQEALDRVMRNQAQGLRAQPNRPLRGNIPPRNRPNR